MGALNKLAGALALTGALSAPVEAQDAETIVIPAASEVSAQVTDCVGFVKEQRDLAADTGISLSRSEQKSLLHECNNGQLVARIAEQEQIFLAPDTAIHQINLRVDENARILDENGQEIARIIAINGQLVIRRQEVRADTEEKLREGTEEEVCKAERKTQRKVERRSARIEVKAAKKRLLTEEQLENLQDRIDVARKKGNDAKVKALAKKFRQKRKQLKLQWKQALEDENLSPTQKATLRQAFKTSREDLKRLNAELLTATEKSLRRQVAPTELQAVATVEPNYLYETQTISFNDPAWPSQWGLQSVGLSSVPIPTGYTLQSQEPITVALVDSGVNFSHADLSGNMWTDPNCVDADGLAIPGGCPNGGYDFVDNDNDPYPVDNISHGTGVASLIGATSNNNTDLASAAGDRVKIMAVRSCCTAEGMFEADSIAEGIYFAVNNGAKIINASFGGPTPSVQIRAALQYAAEHEVLVVAAAGNYASNNDQTPMYPANYNQELPNILSVASTTSWDYLAYFSNYGPQTVDMTAPGQDVITAGLNTSTVTMSGTSFSAPMTASVLAKWWQQNPQLTLSQLKGDFLSALVSLNPITAQVQGGKTLRFAVTPTDPEPTDPIDPVDPIDPTDPTPPDPVDPVDPVEPNPPTDPIDPTNPNPDPLTTKCKALTGQDKKDCRARKKAAREAVRFEKKKARCLAMKKETRRDRCLEKLGLVPGGTTSDIYTYSASGDWSFHHPDHLSGTSVDTDNTGQVIQLYDYYPFGDVRIDNHATGYENDYQFTGKERDDDTNLLYYEARYYDSALSRFTSLDPWEGDLNDPQSFNQTAYVRNNPLKYVDPSGEFFVDLFLPAVAGEDPNTGKVPNSAGVGFDVLAFASVKGIAKNSKNIIGSAIKNIWSDAGEGSVKNAFSHYVKHGKDFEDVANAKQYVEKARNFTNKPPNDASSFVDGRGVTQVYQKSSNTFGLKDPSGVPRTMFKPKQGASYYINQVARSIKITVGKVLKPAAKDKPKTKQKP